MATSFSLRARISQSLARLGIVIGSAKQQQEQASQESRRQAHDWQRFNLASLRTYEPGQYMRQYHDKIAAAVEAAMQPDISQLPTPRPAKNVWIEDATEKMPIALRQKLLQLPPASKPSTVPLPPVHDYAEAVLDAIAHAPRTHSLEREVLKEPRDTWLL